MATSILISTTLFYPSRLGGPANTLYWLAKGLVKGGLKVTVVTTDAHINADWVKPEKWSSLDGVKIRYCRNGLFSPLKMLWHTWKQLDSNDTVMLCDMFQKQVLVTAFMACLCRKRIIWSPRGELFSSALGSSHLKRSYVNFIKCFFGKYAHFHATSIEEQEAIYKHLGESAKVSIIPNYMELPSVRSRNEVAPPYMLYLGRIAPIKALDRLIEGLAKSVCFRDSNTVFKIVGGVEPQFQSYYEELKQMIASYGLMDKVIFVGPLSGDAKYQVYADAHAMFLVSHSENFGNVVIEALSQGTPVIASKGTPWEKLKEKEAGYWIDNNPEEIAKVIDVLLQQSNEDYMKLRENALKFTKDFDIYEHVAEWKNIIA